MLTPEQIQELFDLIEQWKRDNPWFDQVQEIVKKANEILQPPVQYEIVTAPTSGVWYEMVPIRDSRFTSGWGWGYKRRATH